MYIIKKILIFFLNTHLYGFLDICNMLHTSTHTGQAVKTTFFGRSGSSYRT